jgi:hypothetical protein
MQNEKVEPKKKFVILSIIGIVVVIGIGIFYFTIPVRTYQEAIDAQKSGDFPKAIGYFQNLIDYYPNYKEQATIGKINSSLGQARQYGNEGNYSTAVGSYTRFLDEYPNYPDVEVVKNELKKSYSNWIREKITAERYIQAIEINNDFKTKNIDKESMKLSDDLNIEIMNLLANDKGSDGKDVMEQIIADVCNGKKLDETRHKPLVAKDGSKVRSCPKGIVSQEDLIARFPGEFKYVIDLEESTSTLPSCNFFGGYKLIPEQIQWKISIINILTGETEALKTFFGSETDCPDSYLFLKGNYSATTRGDPPQNMDQINTFIKSTIEKGIPETPSTQVTGENILYVEDFFSNEKGWATGKEDISNGEVTREIADGKYLIKLKCSGKICVSLTNIPLFHDANYTLTIDTKVIKSTKSKEKMSLEFSLREVDPEFWKHYDFVIDGDGTSYLDLWLTGKIENIVSLWSHSADNRFSLKDGITNTIEIRMIGSTISASVNGEKIDSVIDTSIGDAGTITIILSLSEPGEIQIEFDNLTIKEAP